MEKLREDFREREDEQRVEREELKNFSQKLEKKVKSLKGKERGGKKERKSEKIE